MFENSIEENIEVEKRGSDTKVRKLHTAEFHNFYSSLNIITYLIKKNEQSGEYNTRIGDNKCIYNFNREISWDKTILGTHLYIGG